MWFRFWKWVFKRRVQQYIEWMDYEVGFTGVGTTALDRPPDFEKPWLPQFMSNKIEADSKVWAAFKQECFQKAMFDVLSEEVD
jgi:hypothetical protein